MNVTGIRLHSRVRPGCAQTACFPARPSGCVTNEEMDGPVWVRGKEGGKQSEELLGVCPGGLVFLCSSLCVQSLPGLSFLHVRKEQPQSRGWHLWLGYGAENLLNRNSTLSRVLVDHVNLGQSSFRFFTCTRRQ